MNFSFLQSFYSDNQVKFGSVSDVKERNLSREEKGLSLHIDYLKKDMALFSRREGNPHQGYPEGYLTRRARVTLPAL